MSNEIRNVTLSFPCREDWEKFEVVPGGRLCGSCKYIVRDFSNCSMTELKEAMKSGQRVCGRFRKDQMSASFLRAAAVVLAVTTLPACEPEVLTTKQNDLTNKPVSEELIGEVDTVYSTGVIAIDDEYDSLTEFETDSILLLPSSRQRHQ